MKALTKALGKGLTSFRVLHGVLESAENVLGSVLLSFVRRRKQLVGSESLRVDAGQRRDLNLGGAVVGWGSVEGGGSSGGEDRGGKVEGEN